MRFASILDRDLQYFTVPGGYCVPGSSLVPHTAAFRAVVGMAIAIIGAIVVVVVVVVVVVGPFAIDAVLILKK